MKIKGKHHHTIWLDGNDRQVIHVFDQRYFPHQIETFTINNSDRAAFAIKEMVVRGAPLIGVTAAYGMYLGCIEAIASSESSGDFVPTLNTIAQKLKNTRPTAVNLAWAVDIMMEKIQSQDKEEQKIAIALETANQIKADDIDVCERIGQYGLQLIKNIAQQKEGKTVNILTHCNAGWLATIDWGTATSPMYHAQKAGIDIHVWVDETRPRNQGANLTAFELNEQGIPHTLITDNTGGHLMQHDMVDIVIVGTDRTTANGDVANKIGTYLKALAAHDNNIPFYVALPSSTLDCSLHDGIKEIPIETRDAKEVKYIQGKDEATGEVKSILICPEDSPAVNYGFDVTPAKYVTGLITERGICGADRPSIENLFPEKFVN